ncbi:MAG: methyltransferase domain-containing protein [Pseudolabrys sp.]|nr:methyltransferase domain-containing protein [Pseudolabrys sp.]
MTGLPPWISAALQSRLEHVPRVLLRDRARAISSAYRRHGKSDVIRTDLDALAYAVVRMPATFAAVRVALKHTIEIIPGFAPQSILDLGAGPGTASWAGATAWPSLKRIVLIDINPPLLDLARDIADSAGAPRIELSVHARNAAEAVNHAAEADVVMASYALTEIAPRALNDILPRVWGLARRLLIIVEPGTSAGYRRILACRDALLGCGAQLVAPCSHDLRCPLASGSRWCHFSARLPRSRDHRTTKDAYAPFEDEKFSYLVAGKGFERLPRGRRILATPKRRKSGITLTLCVPDSPEERFVARAEKHAYMAARRLDWGDATDSGDEIP